MRSRAYPFRLGLGLVLFSSLTYGEGSPLDPPKPPRSEAVKQGYIGFNGTTGPKLIDKSPFTRAELQEAARRFLDEYLKETPCRVESDYVIPMGRLWALNHHVVCHSIPVSSPTDLMLATHPDSRVSFYRPRGIPSQFDGTAPTVKAEDAIAVAKDYFRGHYEEEGEPGAPPKLVYRVTPDGTAHLTWSFYLRTKKRENLASESYWISAVKEPELIHFRDEIYGGRPRSLPPTH